MQQLVMNLKILLPFKIFLEVKNVNSIVAETSNGMYGLLPQRLDFVAALVPGIFTYETATTGTRYIAVDEGLLVKAGPEVMVSVRNAIGGVDIGKLHESVEKEFREIDDSEKNVRSVMTKLESSFVGRLQKFQNE